MKTGINESIVDTVVVDKTQSILILQDKNDLKFINKDLLSNPFKKIKLRTLPHFKLHQA